MPTNSKDFILELQEKILDATKICAFCVHAQHERSILYWCNLKQKGVYARERCELFADPDAHLNRKHRRWK